VKTNEYVGNLVTENFTNEEILELKGVVFKVVHVGSKDGVIILDAAPTNTPELNTVQKQH